MRPSWPVTANKNYTFKSCDTFGISHVTLVYAKFYIRHQQHRFLRNTSMRSVFNFELHWSLLTLMRPINDFIPYFLFCLVNFVWHFLYWRNRDQDHKLLPLIQIALLNRWHLRNYSGIFLILSVPTYRSKYSLIWRGCVQIVNKRK